MSRVSPTESLSALAKELGFELVGTIKVTPPNLKPDKHFEAFKRWLQDGMQADMTHFVRNFQTRKNPSALLPGAQSMIMLGVSYSKVLNSEPHPIQQLNGIVEYARGTDYHRWIRTRLAILTQKHRELLPAEQCRGMVDTAPLFEKHYAAEAGLGTIGKNTLLINPSLGSKFFLAAFLSTLEAECCAPQSGIDVCGDCRQCLDACPTGALIKPFVLDSRRCLSYWTLVHRGTMPKEIAERRGDRFLGCDTCQSVCPHNQLVPSIPQGAVAPWLLDAETLRSYLTGTALEGRREPPVMV